MTSILPLPFTKSTSPHMVQGTCRAALFTLLFLECLGLPPVWECEAFDDGRASIRGLPGFFDDVDAFPLACDDGPASAVIGIGREAGKGIG
jgi:hypothetical protein